MKILERAARKHNSPAAVNVVAVPQAGNGETSSETQPSMPLAW